MPYEFYLGVDAPGASTPVTLALIEKEQYHGEQEVDYHVRLLEQRPDGDAGAVATRVRNLIAAEPYVGRTRIIVNAGSKEGRAVVEALTSAGLSAVAATLVPGKAGGQTAARGRKGVSPSATVSLSESEVAGSAQGVYVSGSLKMGQDTEEVSLLAQELQSIASDDAEVLQPSGSAGTMSALLRSTALACWLGGHGTFHPDDDLEADALDQRPL